VLPKEDAELRFTVVNRKYPIIHSFQTIVISSTIRDSKVSSRDLVGIKSLEIGGQPFWTLSGLITVEEAEVSPSFSLMPVSILRKDEMTGSPTRTRSDRDYWVRVRHDADGRLVEEGKGKH
jgi:hypothetical protein